MRGQRPRHRDPYPIVWQLLETWVHERGRRAHLPEYAGELVALTRARQERPTRRHFREDTPGNRVNHDPEMESIEKTDAYGG